MKPAPFGYAAVRTALTVRGQTIHNARLAPVNAAERPVHQAVQDADGR
jgi:hypothetical protein